MILCYTYIYIDLCRLLWTGVKMSYYLDLGGWSGVFAVPNSLVDKHLKLANENQLKVILWVLRHGGELFSAADIASALGIPVSFAEEAVEYWLQVGVLGTSGNNLIQGKEKQPAQVRSENPVEVKPDTKKLEAPMNRKMLRPDNVYIAGRVREDAGIAFMMQEAEAILGKTLSPALAAVLVIAHDDYSLPPEVITMIVSYCKSVGKTGTAYIESLAKNWSESGVLTLTDAEKKLAELNSHTIAWRKVSSVLGIPTRAATKREDEFSYHWIYELKVSDELIREAYERSVNTTGKLQLKYMNTCLENWVTMGISSAAEIYEQEEKQRLDRNNLSKPSYDMNEIESFNVYTDWKP